MRFVYLDVFSNSTNWIYINILIGIFCAYWPIVLNVVQVTAVNFYVWGEIVYCL